MYEFLNIFMCFCRTVIFVSCFYGCDAWSFTLRENENRLLGEISGYRRDEVRVQLRRLRNEELYDLYPAPHIIRVMEVRRKR